MTDESKLFADFAATRSEPAFQAIVQLHLNLVFATALRQLGDRGLAEEVTQNVFLALAKKAPSLRPNSTLAGWLYQTTLNQSRQRLRSELRRQQREQKAFQFSTNDTEGDSTWAAIIPLLDEALLSLQEHDRLAVILRYMEDRPLHEIGRALGIGEDAARKRLNRILEQLTSWFRDRGFALPSATIISALSLEGYAAPLTLLSSVTAAALSTLTLSTSISIVALLMSTKAKIMVAALLIALAITTPILMQSFSSAPLPAGTITSNVPLTNSSSASLDVQSAQTASGTFDSPADNNSQLAANAPGEKSIFERINEGDESLTYLDRSQAEAFLVRNKTNAQSLLAAFKVTQDTDYLRRAATNFPNDPAVLLRVTAHDAFPEARRPWLDQFKTQDPENALAWYLSARDYLKSGQVELALEELSTAAAKGNFQDYVTDHMFALEEIYLAAGHTPAVAKTLGMSAVELPHVSQLADLSNSLADLMKQNLQAGDHSSAEGVARIGLNLANHLNSIQDGGNLLGEMVAIRIENKFLSQLDPTRSYSFLDQPVPDRISSLASREQAIRADSEFFSRWIAKAPETEILTYFDRLKFYGEAAALEWLKTRE